MTENELKFKIDLAVDRYACEHAEFNVGYMFEGEHSGNIYEINAIFGELSYKNGNFHVGIRYACECKSDGKSFSFPESYIKELKKID